MKRRTAGGTCAVALSMALLACSPALNWRETRIGTVTALLPCKPDKAQRDVPLGSRVLGVELQGCEAQHMLFAISHIALQDPQQASAVIADWRSATLVNMRSTEVVERSYRVKGLPSHAAAVQITAQGRDASGAPVQAKLAWFVSGANVFHLAVYGSKLLDDLSEPLFSELKASP